MEHTCKQMPMDGFIFAFDEDENIWLMETAFDEYMVVACPFCGQKLEVS